MSVLELLVALMVGASVQLAAESDRADPDRLRRFMVAHEVTWAEVAPALLPLLDPADLPLVRSVVTGAEAPGPEQVARWTAGGRRLMNGYGPTETTVAVCRVRRVRRVAHADPDRPPDAQPPPVRRGRADAAGAAGGAGGAAGRRARA